jgi:hypothetical protein
MGGEHEIDLIVERRDQRRLAIEVKLSRQVEDKDVRHLRWLAGQLGADLVDAVVVNVGSCGLPPGRRDRSCSRCPAGTVSTPQETTMVRRRGRSPGG